MNESTPNLPTVLQALGAAVAGIVMAVAFMAIVIAVL